MKNAKILGIIPARYASSRLPAKLLKDICGKSVLQRVYEQCTKSSTLHKIIIVTDHLAIFEHALSFKAEVVLSKKEHSSGTDRIAEIVESLQEYSLIINIQGDEPFLDPSSIDKLANLMLEQDADIASLAISMTDRSLIKNPNIVKLITDHKGKALYFSRAEIPFLRDDINDSEFTWKRHIGIYGFKRKILLELSKLPISSLEKIESLEQLRWLEHGYQIYIGMIHDHAAGIDTAEDLANAIQFAKENNL